METERLDVGKLKLAAREQWRRTALRRHRRGHTQEAIARELGVRRPTVTGWIAQAQTGQGVKEAARGRPLGDGRRVTPAQEERLRQALVDKTPAQVNLRFALWSAQAVRALIQAYFGIDLPVRSVRTYLKRWGFTPQRPLKRAFEQKPAAVQKWLTKDYPAIAARAKAQGAEICWGEETAVSSVEHYPRGYAPKGKTPVLVLSQAKRERINLISAIPNPGAMRFMMYPHTLTAKVLITFLKRLIREAGRKVFLVLDNRRGHHRRKGRDWLAQHTEQIELFFLPSYSPELNPDESLNADLKARLNATEPGRDRAHLKRKVISHLRSIQKQPARIRSYFNAERIQYAA